MTNENVKELMEKYWAGETTLAEEQQIRKYQAMGLVDDSDGGQLMSYFQQMSEMSSQREFVMPEEPKAEARVVSIRRWMPMLLSIAASLTLLAAVLFSWPSAKAQHREITDPNEALEVTYAALSILNSKIDRSEGLVKDNLQLVEKTRLVKIL